MSQLENAVRTPGRDRVVNLVMLAAAALLYGAIFPINRLAAEAGWPPVAFAFWQSLLAGLLMGCVVLARRHTLLATRRHAVAYLVLGALGIGLPTGLLARAAGHVPGSTLTLVLAMSPICTLVFAGVLKLERFRVRTLAAVLLGLTGVALIAAPGSAGMPDGALLWFLLALLAPVMFAATNIAAILLRPPATGSVTMAAGILLGAAVVMLPVALALDPALLPPASASALAAVLLSGGVNALVFVLFFEIVRRAGPTFFSMFNYLAIAAGVAWSMALYAEQPPPVFWLAALVMLAGVYMALGGRPQPAGA